MKLKVGRTYRIRGYSEQPLTVTISRYDPTTAHPIAMYFGRFSDDSQNEYGWTDDGGWLLRTESSFDLTEEVLELKLGHYYRSRAGDIVRAQLYNFSTSPSEYKALGFGFYTCVDQKTLGTREYERDGRWVARQLQGIYYHDLIEELTEEEAKLEIAAGNLYKSENITDHVAYGHPNKKET